MIPITKYHGVGNDFLITTEEAAAGVDLQELIVNACDCHTGIGADGFMLVRQNPLTMLFYNCDGSPAPMCGNGIRCFARFLAEEGLVREDVFDVGTKAGIKRVEILSHTPFLARVAMGKPDYTPAAIGVKASRPIRDFAVSAGGHDFVIDSFFMSTVHTVTFVDDPENKALQAAAGALCVHPMFTEKTNVNLVKVLDRNTLLMRTWERGVGMTLACGTGACAAAASAFEKGFCERKVEVLLPKGRLLVEIEQDGQFFMSGPAERILKGELEC